MKKLILALVLTSCAASKADLKVVGNATLDCGKQTLIESASQLVPAFIGILSADIGNWKQQADVLGKEFGKDVAICAARTAVAKIVSPVQSEATPQDPETVKRTVTARLRSIEIEAGFSNN